MEFQAPSPMKSNSTVDTSRAFSSVKEAVAIFGEKILSGELYSSPSVFSSPTPKQELSPLWFSPKAERDMCSASSTSLSKQNSLSPKSSPVQMQTKYGIDDQVLNGEPFLLETLKRLESELEETKMELKQLKERESETEVALASLNAELHKNMSKIAQSEAMAAATARTSSLREGERKRELIMKLEKEGSPTLAEILGFGEERKRNKDMMKKKPVVPIITHWFSRKKGGVNDSLHSSIFASPHVFLN